MENNQTKYIVYCTTSVVNKKINIGVHQTNRPYEFDGYLGTGVYISRTSTYEHSKCPFQFAVKTYGVNKFIRTTIKVCDTEEDALFLESELVNEEFLKRTDVYNIMPPHNGEGDHLILAQSDNVRYVKFQMPYYNQYKSFSYSLIEKLEHPYKLMYMGFMWFHLSSTRVNLKDKIVKAVEIAPNSICNLDSFSDKSFKTIVSSSDPSIFSPFQRILFSFIHNAYIYEIPKYTHILRL